MTLQSWAVIPYSQRLGEVQGLSLLVSVFQHSLTVASQVSCLSPGVPGTPPPPGMGSCGVLCGLHVLAGVPSVVQAGPQAMLWGGCGHGGVEFGRALVQPL